jgi:hypothetical protein
MLFLYPEKDTEQRCAAILLYLCAQLMQKEKKSAWRDRAGRSFSLSESGLSSCLLS